MFWTFQETLGLMPPKLAFQKLAPSGFIFITVWLPLRRWTGLLLIPFHSVCTSMRHYILTSSHSQPPLPNKCLSEVTLYEIDFLFHYSNIVC